MASKRSADVLPGFPKHKKVIICFVEKICVLDKLCLGMNYSDVGHDFNVYESSLCIK